MNFELTGDKKNQQITTSKKGEKRVSFEGNSQSKMPYKSEIKLTHKESSESLGFNTKEELVNSEPRPVQSRAKKENFAVSNNFQNEKLKNLGDNDDYDQQPDDLPQQTVNLADAFKKRVKGNNRSDSRDLEVTEKQEKDTGSGSNKRSKEEMAELRKKRMNYQPTINQKKKKEASQDSIQDKTKEDYDENGKKLPIE